MEGPSTGSPSTSVARTRVRRLVRCAAWASALVIPLGFVGQIVRDRSVVFALFMYVPLLPVGLIATALDLFQAGKTLPLPRFAVTALGLCAATLSSFSMIGSGKAPTFEQSSNDVSVLHWNIQWGGGLFRSPSTWSAQRAAIRKRNPDLIVLSELPPREWLLELVRDLGADASYAGVEHERGERYWCHVAVCSRWPVASEEHWRWPGGVALAVSARVRGEHLRILVVDGRSNPFQSRLPFLQAIADVCQSAEEQGRPFDVILGDFNTPSRSIGFDALIAQDYAIASRSARGWRGTFPAWLPLYDIDHVLLARRYNVAQCELFNGPFTDHRGQFVRFTPRSALHAATLP
jgi:endonuclease/exonuclease/phosphatase family metal-dependent hydrolase